jgi:hypothetical protein
MSARFGDGWGPHAATRGVKAAGVKLGILVAATAGCVGRPAFLGAIESEGQSAGGSDAGGESTSTAGGMDDGSTGADGGATTGAIPEVCTEIDVGAGAERRLDDQQYANTIRDLLGVDYAFPAQERGDPFPTAWSDNPGDLYAVAAEEVAALVDMAALAPCSLGATGAAADACEETFIDEVGRRAFRHTLTDDERNALFEIADNAAPTLEESLRTVLGAMLSHPSFTWPTVTGTPAPEGAPVIELDAWSLASRLSYFIWNSTPDDQLLAAAESNALLDPSELAAQAQRMLADPRAQVMHGDLYDHLLQTRTLPQLGKVDSLIPPWSEQLGESMLVEQRRFVGDVATNGSLADLLGATHTFVDEELGVVYGADVQGLSPEGPAFQRVELAAHRMGVLTRLAFQTQHAGPGEIALPSRRGLVVLDAFYCLSIPPPPPDIDVVPPEPPFEGSFREMWEEAHLANPACSACHVVFDGIGWAFANYDPLGRWVDEVGGYPVDPAGDAPALEPPVEFEDAAALMQAMIDDERVGACVAQRYFEFAVRRGLDERDDCTLQQIAAQFEAADGSFHELALAIVGTRAFRLARP